MVPVLCWAACLHSATAQAAVSSSWHNEWRVPAWVLTSYSYRGPTDITAPTFTGPFCDKTSQDDTRARERHQNVRKALRILRVWCTVCWCEDGAGEGQPGPVWWEDVAVPSRLPAPGLLGTTAAKPHQKMQIVWWYDAMCPQSSQVQVCHSSVVCHQ